MSKATKEAAEVVDAELTEALAITPHAFADDGEGTCTVCGRINLDDAHLLDDTKNIDVINRPPHYTSHPSGVECIDITEHFGFNLGNVIKYVWRADHKNGIEDLEKARFYIDREIQRREKFGT